jgi:polysaccharide export outer membrane protein
MPLKSFRGLLPLMAASLCWAGSAVAGQESGTVASQLAPKAPTESEQAAQADYRIGAGDKLNVYVWNHPELTLEVPVRPDGKISTPLIESLPAAGKTPLQLAREMEAALSEYVRAPKVNVIVTGFVGDLPDQVRVIGQAAKPQSLPFRANMTVLDVLIASGGLGQFAAGNRAHIVRTVDGQPTKIKVRLADIAEKGDLRTNIPVRPGDVLVIPESRF